MTSKQFLKSFAPLLAGMALIGCAHQSADRVEADFGASKRAMLNGQFYDPEAARNPSTEAPTGLDGVKAEEMIKAYREDNSDRKFVEEPINFGILGL